MKGRRPNYAWDDLSPAQQRARFMRSVEKRPDGCWYWTGKRQKTGYGRVEISFYKKKRSTGAHRLAWELFVGPIPTGKLVLHHCDQPPCVNWTKCLFLGDEKENIRDMLAKGRQRPARGALAGNAKLTEATVRAIRTASAEGKKQADLAVLFKVSRKQISVIVSRKQWTHI